MEKQELFTVTKEMSEKLYRNDIILIEGSKISHGKPQTKSTQR